MPDTIKLHTSVKMIAHRGVSGLEPENTGAAFLAAGTRSYYGIETDVHCTKDGRFIVIHDDTTQRTTGKRGTVEKMTFDELRALPVKALNGVLRHDLRLPSLEEYIRTCKAHSKQSILELKNHMLPHQIQTLVDIIRAEGWLERTTFISFELPNMLFLRRLLPNQPLQFLTKSVKDKLLRVLEEYRLDLDAKFQILTPKLVDACHRRGLLVNAWTVNTPGDAMRLIDMGVDFITTNILE